MRHYYCSAFSGEYCYQALVLYDSIRKNDSCFTLFCVCLDTMAYDVLSRLVLDNLIVIDVKKLEDYFPELRNVKQDRSMSEYAWTIKSSEMLYIFENYSEVDRIIWLDGDTQMLSNPKVIFDEWNSKSVILTEQYYTDNHEALIMTYGRFQAGLVGFARDNEGIACLKWWRQKCIEWCYGRFEDGRWADQKYLDYIPQLFSKICIVKSLGINMTPFVLYRLNFEQQKYMKTIEDQLFVNGIKIVLFHFYGFRYIDETNYDLCKYWMKFSRDTIEHLYVPYIEASKKAIAKIETVWKDYKLAIQRLDKHITCHFEIKRNNLDASFDIATIVNETTLQEALALYYSIEQKCRDFYWWVCCTDIESFNKLRVLKLCNVTALHISSILDSTQRNKLSDVPEYNSLERLKAFFLYYLLNNNYSINKIIYIGSCYYFFDDIQSILASVEGKRAFIFSQNSRKKTIRGTRFEKDIIGFIKCDATVNFLKECAYKPKGVFSFTDMAIKHLNAYKVTGSEYNCILGDLVYSRLMIKNDGVYINQRPIRIFCFDNNESQKNKLTQSNRKVKLYLNKDLYKRIYEPYNRALERASQYIDSI